MKSDITKVLKWPIRQISVINVMAICVQYHENVSISTLLDGVMLVCPNDTFVGVA